MTAERDFTQASRNAPRLDNIPMYNASPWAEAVKGKWGASVLDADTAAINSGACRMDLVVAYLEQAAYYRGDESWLSMLDAMLEQRAKGEI